MFSSLVLSFVYKELMSFSNSPEVVGLAMILCSELMRNMVGVANRL